MAIELDDEPTWPTFIETREFTQDWKREGLDDETYRTLQTEIAGNWANHPVMAGTGGVRKVRFSDTRDNRGKSGSYWACYVYLTADGRVFMVALFGKNEKPNLTAEDKRILSAYVANLKRTGAGS